VGADYFSADDSSFTDVLFGLRGGDLNGLYGCGEREQKG
jgi:hypothetical protein